MENIYFLILVTLALLAIVDIVVGVSNDAINFLNSAIGSKVLSFRTIMIVSSIGIFIGADGVSWGRYIFSASCFLYTLGCSNLIHKFKKIFLYDSK